MHILFVENRNITFLLESIAKLLIQDGHRISWLVQNHLYQPRDRKLFRDIHVIPYPSKRQDVSNSLNAKLDEKYPDFDVIIPADRGVKFFGGESSHYIHYYKNIKEILESEVIDVVFGETTLFHELITEYVCNLKDVPYLHPVATRIPSGRLQFFKGRTMKSIGGGNNAPAFEDLSFENEALNKRKSVAFMNSRAGDSRLSKKIDIAADRFKVVIGRFFGEIYNTPSLIKKLSLERDLKVRKVAFNKVVNLPKSGCGKYLLYPLQMQPETNIDIWSVGNSDQSEIIKGLSEQLVGTNFRLLVKFNPHSKYELLDDNLLVLADRVDFLPFDFGMSEALEMSDAVISVTGSVILECISMQKPIFVVGNHEMSQLPGVNQLGSVNEIVNFIADGLENHVTPTKEDGINYLQKLYLNSYSGIWFDPVNMSEFATDKNIEDITMAFRDVLNLLRNKRDEAL